MLAVHEWANRGGSNGLRNDIRDAAELRWTQKQYRDMGMTDVQATADWYKNLIADDAGRMFSVV